MAWLELERPSKQQASHYFSLVLIEYQAIYLPGTVQCWMIESCDGRKFQSAMKFKTPDTYFLKFFFTPLEIEIILSDVAEAGDATKMHKI